MDKTVSEIDGRCLSVSEISTLAHTCGSKDRHFVQPPCFRISHINIGRVSRITKHSFSSVILKVNSPTVFDSRRGLLRAARLNRPPGSRSRRPSSPAVGFAGPRNHGAGRGCIHGSRSWRRILDCAPQARDPDVGRRGWEGGWVSTCRATPKPGTRYQSADGSPRGREGYVDMRRCRSGLSIVETTGMR